MVAAWAPVCGPAGKPNDVHASMHACWYNMHPLAHMDTCMQMLVCPAGLLKRYGVDINRTDILQANLDSQSLPVAVVAEAAELNK